MEKANELITVVGDRIQAEIERRFPIVIEAVVVAITKTMGDLTVNGVDKVTDMIPGQLDDQIVDPLVRNIRDEINRRFGIKL
ncbi:hypothetical protein H7K31_24700 [Mycolicibacterium bacteremicum]|uniref:Uncharacterized protein n=1 Tax=Mycolicibacterium bacteremicum TaxID=564198 RepID=A0A1W9Z0Y7_MYCBA|nr:hypothetical protein [Mycolicibacterium bacteremicum]ORA05849.1 hypothetical protein BST17_08510 [Mycolicibacterium bacteremicum]